MKFLFLIAILFIETCLSMPAYFHESNPSEDLFYEEAKLFKKEVRNMLTYSKEIANNALTFEKFENSLKEYHIRRSNELEQSDNAFFFHYRENFAAASLYEVYCRIIANKTIDKVLSEIGLSETQEQLLNKTKTDVISDALNFSRKAKPSWMRVRWACGILDHMAFRHLAEYRENDNCNLRVEVEMKIFRKTAEGLAHSYELSKDITNRLKYNLREPEYYLRKMYKMLYPGQEVPENLYEAPHKKGCVIM